MRTAFHVEMAPQGSLMDLTPHSNGTERSLAAGDGHVKEVLSAAHEELKHLLSQRAEIIKRIGTIKQTIVGLANIFGDEILSNDLLELVDRKPSRSEERRVGKE